MIKFFRHLSFDTRTSLAIVGAYACIPLIILSLGESFIPALERSTQKLSMRQRLEQKLYEKKYEKAYVHLFGERGMADLDKDGIFSLKEQTEVLQRLGYKSLIWEGRDNFQFQKPTLNQLEQAIRSYEVSKER